MASSAAVLLALAGLSHHAPRAGAPRRAPDLHQAHAGLGGELAVEAWAVPPRTPAGLCAWFVRHPAASACLCWWSVTVIHLRPGEGLAPPVLNVEGQTHELWVMALNPDSDISPDRPERATFLSPSEQVLPLCGLTDAQAEQVCRAAVQRMVAGYPPDSGHLTLWRAWAEHTCAAVLRGAEGR